MASSRGAERLQLRLASLSVRGARWLEIALEIPRGEVQWGRLTSVHAQAVHAQAVHASALLSQ